MTQLTLYTDGGARGNPGPAGIGVVAYEGAKKVLQVSEYIGVRTNNWAEYCALIRGLEEVARHYNASCSDVQVCVYMDSDLIVNQLNGVYRVKNPELKKQYEKVRALASTYFPHMLFAHIPREKNKEADRLANEAMDGAMRSV